EWSGTTRLAARRARAKPPVRSLLRAPVSLPRAPRPAGRYPVGLTMAVLRSLLQAEAWGVALEKYGAATSMTVAVYEAPEHLILGPVHPTALFEAVSPVRDVQPIFRECVRQCLSQDTSATIIDHDGVAVLVVRRSLA